MISAPPFWARNLYKGTQKNQKSAETFYLDRFHMMNKLLILFLVFSCSLKAENKKTVCLNMIVKNESQVIERCLGSLKKLIDYWVIVDTGSTDGTQDKIRSFLKNVPGELYERPWVDFAHNRNEALQLAKNKGDYLLIIDADEVLQMADSFSLPHLTKDYYCLVMRELNAADVRRVTFIKNSLPWKWEGILHEVLVCPEAVTFEWLHGISNICNLGGGARSKDPQKFLKDAQVLERGLEKEPNNSRYVFYLAQSYLSAEKYDLALKNFERRVAMPGEPEETFLALMNLAMCQMNLKMPLEMVTQSFFRAYEFRPTRAEPLLQAAVLYRKNGNPFLGYLITKFALEIPRPPDAAVVYTVYDYALLIEFANCALLLNRNQEGFEACEKLLINPALPPEYRGAVNDNWNLAKNRLMQQLENRTVFDTLRSGGDVYFSLKKRGVDYKFMQAGGFIDDFVLNKFQNWENETFDVFEKVKDPNSVAIDIGAWIGTTSIWLSHHFAHVVAIEPDRDSVKMLKKNLTASGCDNITICEKAVARDKKTVLFGPRVSQMDKLNSSMSYIKGKQDSQNDYYVQGVPLKQLVDECLAGNLDHRRISFIKCDIEGGEEEILEDLLHFALDHKTKVYVSFHLDWWQSRKMTDFKRLFEKFKTNCPEKDVCEYIQKNPFQSILFEPL